MMGASLVLPRGFCCHTRDKTGSRRALSAVRVSSQLLEGRQEAIGSVRAGWG
jgi:hypothetical protein